MGAERQMEAMENLGIQTGGSAQSSVPLVCVADGTEQKKASWQKPQTVKAFMTRDEALPWDSQRGQGGDAAKQLISCKTHGGFQRHWWDCWGYGDPTVNSGIRDHRETSMCSLVWFLNSQIVVLSRTHLSSCAWEPPHVRLALFPRFRGQREGQWEEGCRHPLCVVLSHKEETNKGAAVIHT